MKQLLLLLTLVFSLSACSLVSDSFRYSETAENFVESFMRGDHEAALQLMALEHESAQNIDRATLKEGMEQLRANVLQHFGSDLSYSFIKTEKTFTTGENKQMPNTTLLYLQLANDKEFGQFQVTFDDASGKVLYIQLQDMKAPIPDLLPFWVFCLFTLAVLVFNIYAIVQVKKSQVTKKWQKYLLIVLLNVPTIGWSAMGGFFVKLLNIQMMLGVSFSMMGYAGTACAFGFPLGALFVLWKLRQGKYDTVDMPEQELVID
jgi:hypothetical protein